MTGSGLGTARLGHCGPSGVAGTGCSSSDAGAAGMAKSYWLGPLHFMWAGRDIATDFEKLQGEYTRFGNYGLGRGAARERSSSLAMLGHSVSR